MNPKTPGYRAALADARRAVDAADAAITAHDTYRADLAAAHSIKLPVPALDMDFRDWVIASVMSLGPEGYADAAARWEEERWVGSTTRSLQMHLRAREYRAADDAIFAHLRDIWEKWLRFREAMDDRQYGCDK